VHAERLEEALGDELLRPNAGRPLDHPADEAPAEIGVLEPRAGRPRERHAGVDQGVHAVGRKAEVTVRPRVVGGETGFHRDEMADRERWAVGGRATPAGELGHVGRDRLVEADRPLDDQRHQCRAGEGLRHRRDPEGAVRVGQRVLADPQRADASGRDELTVVDQTPGDRGRVLDDRPSCEDVVEVGQRSQQIHGCPSLVA
jgi:hypothetical protein